MKRIKITLNTIKDITTFCNEAQKIKGDVFMYKDKFIVDAKSLMGLLSIDLSTGAEVEYSDNEEFDKYCQLYAD